MSDYVQVDALGRVGLSADPDALLTVGGRLSSPTDADILAGAKPWAWYDATDWNGDGTIEVLAEDTRIAEWGDKANYPSTDRSMVAPTNLGMRYYNRVRQAFEAKRVSVTAGLPGSVERGNGYLSQFNDAGSVAYYYSSLKGITFSPSFSAWSVVAVVGMDAGAIHQGMMCGINSAGGRPGPRIMVMGDGADAGGYGSFDILNTNPALDSPNPAWEQFQSAGNIPTVPSRAKFTVRVQSHTAGGRYVTCTVDGASGANFDADNLAQYKNHPFWYKSLGTFQETAGGVFTLSNLYYAEVMVFEHVLTTAELNLIHAYLSSKYHKNYVAPAYDLLSISDTPVASADYVNVTSAGTVGLSTQPTTPVTPTAQLQMAQRATPLDFLKVEDAAETDADYVHVDHEGLVGLSATPDGTALLQMKERTVQQDFLTLKDTV